MGHWSKRYVNLLFWFEPLHSTWNCCYNYFLLCFACVLPPAMSVSQATSETSSCCLSHSSPSLFSVLWLLLDAGASLHLQNSWPFLLWGFWIAIITISGRLEDKKIARETEVWAWLWTSTKDENLGTVFSEKISNFLEIMEEGSVLLFEDMDIS